MFLKQQLLSLRNRCSIFVFVRINLSTFDVELPVEVLAKTHKTINFL